MARFYDTPVNGPFPLLVTHTSSADPDRCCYKSWQDICPGPTAPASLHGRSNTFFDIQQFQLTCAAIVGSPGHSYVKLAELFLAIGEVRTGMH
ncbi:hypothetical protein E2562_029808 [Oryza meyeriana var. granulata]|uniref:Uncharacterized protein n=1 Tax=Oryza meyeriana var. granulata TaxID=110450 RepID=A0A6G1CKU1_9ORYZ|nr:hypothetical protein E2562_029808 [Oryza meyeriana var. granulata]